MSWHKNFQHIAQTSFELGLLLKRYALALAGSIERDICLFQSRLFRAFDISISLSIERLCPLAMSAACAAILAAITPSVTSSTDGKVKCS